MRFPGKEQTYRSVLQMLKEDRMYISPPIFTQEMFDDLVLDKNKPIDVEFRVVKDLPQLPEKV